MRACNIQKKAEIRAKKVIAKKVAAQNMRNKQEQQRVAAVKRARAR